MSASDIDFDWHYLGDDRQHIKTKFKYGGKDWTISTVEMPYFGHILASGIQDMLGYNFETMVFNDVGDEQDCERYTDIDQAKEGHLRMLKKWASSSWLRRNGITKG